MSARFHVIDPHGTVWATFSGLLVRGFVLSAVGWMPRAGWWTAAKVISLADPTREKLVDQARLTRPIFGARFDHRFFGACFTEQRARPIVVNGKTEGLLFVDEKGPLAIMPRMGQPGEKSALPRFRGFR